MNRHTTTRTGRNAQGFKRSSTVKGSNAALLLVGMEGWRGVAAMLVLLDHVWMNMGTDGTGIGPGFDHPAIAWIFGNIDIVVDLFFVLSGVLIWLPFARAAFDDSVDVPTGSHFIYRRFLRVFPLYWTVVAIVWCTRNFGVGTAQWLDLVEHLTLTQGFDSQRIFYTIGPAWTMSVEWMFYLTVCFVGPSFVRWIRRGGVGTARRLLRMGVALGGVIWVSIAFKANVAMVWHKPVVDWAWRYGPVGKADTFAIGMLLAGALVLMGRRTITGWALLPILAAAVASYWWVKVPPGVDHNLHFQTWRHPMAALAFALVLFGVATTRWRWVPRAIDNRALLRLSILAYPIYVVHEPIVLLMIKLGLFSTTPSVAAYVLNSVVLSVVVVFAAWVAHRLLEEPWIDLGVLRDRRGHRVELYPDLLTTQRVVREQRLPVAAGLRDGVLVDLPVEVSSRPAAHVGRPAHHPSAPAAAASAASPVPVGNVA